METGAYVPRYKLMSNPEITADRDHRRRWSAAEKRRLFEEPRWSQQHLDGFPSQWEPRSHREAPALIYAPSMEATVLAASII